MPIYTWRNDTTGDYAEVERRMDDSNVPPDFNDQWTRIITTAGLMPSHEHDKSLVRERKYQQATKTARGRRGKGRFTHTTGVK